MAFYNDKEYLFYLFIKRGPSGIHPFSATQSSPKSMIDSRLCPVEIALALLV